MILKLDASEGKYLRTISKIDRLTEEQERAYTERIKAGDLKARAELVKACLYLVIEIAEKYTCSRISKMDLISEGNMALVKIGYEFDPNRHPRFSILAERKIKQRMIEIWKQRRQDTSLSQSLDTSHNSISSGSHYGDDIDYLVHDILPFLLNTLTALQRQHINHNFGLTGDRLKYAETAKICGNVTEETSRKTVKAALKRMSRVLAQEMARRGIAMSTFIKEPQVKLEASIRNDGGEETTQQKIVLAWLMEEAQKKHRR